MLPLQLTCALQERGALPQRRFKSLHSQLAGSRHLNAAAVPRRRRAAGVLAAAERDSQEWRGPLVPPQPEQGLPRLVQLAAGAALLLPLAAAGFGLFPYAAAARPSTQCDSPVAQRANPSEVIDENTGSAQPWLYSRGPWNQKQYGTIHTFYTDRSKLRKTHMAAAAASTVPDQMAAQKEAPPAVAAAPDASCKAAPVVSAPSMSSAAAKVAEVAAAAKQAASTASQAVSGYAQGLAARADHLGAQVTDALVATNLSDPQTQKTLAVFSTAVLVLLVFAGRQHLLAGNDQHADSSGDANDGERSATGASAAVAGAAADGWAGMSLKERQAEAARRITAAKQRILEAKKLKDKQAVAVAKAADAVAAREDTAVAKAAKAEAALEAAAADEYSRAVLETAEAAVAEAEAAVIVDMEIIAEGGSVGKLTTDAAAALAVANAVAVAAVERQRQQMEVQAARDEVAALPGKMTADASVSAAVAAVALPGRTTADAAVADPGMSRPGGRSCDELPAAATPAATQAQASAQLPLERPSGRGDREQLAAASVAADVQQFPLERPGSRGRGLDAAPEPVYAASGGTGAQAVATEVAGAGDMGAYLNKTKDHAAPFLALFGFFAATADVLSPVFGRRGSMAARTGAGLQQQGKRWDPVSILLAPAAPLLASIVGSSGEVTRRNKYDMLIEVLSAAAAAPEVQGDSRYDPVRSLLAVVPSTGVPRYDFARSLLRGMAAADTDGDSTFDMAAGLLQSVREGSLVPTGASRYDPLWPLLKEATMLQEWGISKFDPLYGLSDWVAPTDTFAGLRHDPWSDLLVAVREGRAAAASKYDPLPALLNALSTAATAPSGASRYDPAAGVLALACSPSWQGPSGSSRYCMVAAALDVAAGWEAPTGTSKYCPAAAVLAAEGPTKVTAGRSRWDPTAWLLNGWAANSGGWDPTADAAGSHKFDPAAALLQAAAPSHSHRSKFDPVQDLLAGEWLEVDYSEELSVAANSAATRFFGSNGATQQQHEPTPSLAQEASGWN